MAPPVTPEKAEIGRSIKAARDRKKLSMDTAAALVGTTRFQWIRWEKGENVPGERYAPRLAEILDLDPRDLALRDEEAALSGEPFRRPRRPSTASGRAGRGESAGASVTEDAA